MNGCGKQWMKKEFVAYYSSVNQQLDGGKRLEEIEVDFHLSVQKKEFGIN